MGAEARTEETTDPRRLAFITPGTSWSGEEEGIRGRVLSNATIFHTSDHGAESEILARIEEHVKAYGTLEEIYIDAHGSPNRLDAASITPAPDTSFQTDDFLNHIYEIQKKLGVKAVHRIVFSGCNVMADLTPGWVRYYRNTAKELGTEIAGYTTIRWATWAQAGRAVVFKPDGSVARDRLDSDPAYLKHLHEDYAKSATGIEVKDGSDSWFTAHAGRSQKDGALLQEKQQRINISNAETVETVTIGGEVFVGFSDIPADLQLSAHGPKEWLKIVEKLEETDPEGFGPSLKKEETSLIWAAHSRNPEHDATAVKDHEDFIRHLPPEKRAMVLHVANELTAPAKPPVRIDAHIIGFMKRSIAAISSRL